MPGKVTLVGAGPGDPGLLTRKGLEALERADVVVYDRLVSPAILALMPEGAVKINVGKEASRHPVPQEQINRILLEQAQQGHNVVRLKGGDPFLFGRGGEELELLAEHRIPFEEVPGITSAIAAPAYGGIPVTHRDCCSSLHIVTGHQRAGKELAIDFEALVRTGGTLVFLMGVSALPTICAGLLDAGMAPDTRRRGGAGTTPAQRRVSASWRSAPGGGSGRRPEPRRHCGGGRVRPGRPVRLVRPPPLKGSAWWSPGPGAGRHPVGPPAGAGADVGVPLHRHRAHHPLPRRRRGAGAAVRL
ncbi:MAG: uroporphyrinogen-III C-methyltransferase [Flavonifractor plautii]